MTAANNSRTELEFQITDTELYATVVTLSTENDKKIDKKMTTTIKMRI